MTFSKRTAFELGLAVLVVGCCLLTFLWALPKEEQLSLNENQITYNGSIANDRLNGHGTLTYSNGDTYEGSFKNGTFDGEGIFTSSQGWSYQGDFVKGQAEGQGKLVTEDNRVFEGNFRKGIYQK